MEWVANSSPSPLPMYTDLHLSIAHIRYKGMFINVLLESTNGSTEIIGDMEGVRKEHAKRASVALSQKFSLSVRIECPPKQKHPL